MKERLSILQNSMRLGWFFGYNSRENKYLHDFIYENPDVWRETYLDYNFLRLSMYIEYIIHSKYLNEKNLTV